MHNYKLYLLSCGKGLEKSGKLASISGQTLSILPHMAVIDDNE